MRRTADSKFRESAEAGHLVGGLFADILVVQFPRLCIATKPAETASHMSAGSQFPAHGDGSSAAPPHSTPPAEFLTMRLRDFLHSATSNGAAAIPCTTIPEEGGTAGHSPVRVSETSTRAPAGHVWIDCYFYGFFMEESKAREAGMLPPDGSATATAVHVQAPAIAC